MDHLLGATLLDWDINHGNIEFTSEFHKCPTNLDNLKKV
jgi:hypothetical protein